MAGAGRQAEPPRQQVPGNRPQQGGEERGCGDKVSVHQALADRARHRRAGQRAQQIEERGQNNCLPRGQHFCGNRRRDGVGGIVEAVDILEDQRHPQNGQDDRHGGSGMLQRDVGDDIAGVPAAVDDLFQQLVKVLQRNDLHWLMFAAEQLLVERRHVVVSLAFEKLELVIEGLHLFQVHALA